MIAQPEEICTEIKNSLVESNLYSPDAESDDPVNTWRISPDSYALDSQQVAFFDQLGDHLLSFYQTLNQFYLESVKGKLPPWIAEYLDMGKPPDLVAFSRMKRFKRALPGIIRPDVLVTDDGFKVTELDSVPGGFGLTARLMSIYGDLGGEMIGDAAGGIPGLFYQMIETVSQRQNPTVAIVVSDEAADYKSEMVYLANHMKKQGLPVYSVHPSEIGFREEGLFLKDDAGGEVRLDVIYRFFELFDLKNIPKAELMMYSAKKGRVQTTPPYKPHLEEKLSFALFHHPALASLWENALGGETFATLNHLIPKTWILDNREMPPHGVIPGLVVKGAPIQDWSELFSLTQKERELIVKPSGFSPNAWGSRGVVVGHDVSGEEWTNALQGSLQRFDQEPAVLQVFHKGRRERISYVDSHTQAISRMESRVRLTPYYFVVDDSARLGGILATLVPHDKKKIHGMTDAVMVPCAVAGKTTVAASAE